MKFLIYGGCHVADEYTREVVILWARLMRHLNPDVEIVLYDTASPFRPDAFVPKKLEITHIRFEDNPGHLSSGGGDGAGRTHMAGIELAIEDNCDYACHVGTDMFFTKPIYEVVRRMYMSSVRVACLPLSQYQFFEWELSCFNAQWAKERDFVGRYDWRSVKGKIPPGVTHHSQLRKYMPEFRLQEIAGEDLWLLPYHGWRNDGNRVDINPFNMHLEAPYHPPVWIHMARDIRTYHRLLQLNEIELNA